jgi:RNA polymerase sigma-70 factor (ECF subfamily)
MDDAPTGLDQKIQDEARRLRAQFERSIEPHRAALWAYCHKVTGSIWDAEDLAQDTVTRALGRLAHFGQVLNPRAYLFRIATNAWLDRVRGEPLVPLEAARDLASPASPSRAADVSDAMTELVAVLTPGQRVVWLLVEAFAFRPAEVAAMVGTTEGAVKAMLHRARGALQRHQTRASARRGLRPPEGVVARYLDAFNRRDVDALVALFDVDATNVILGDWEEHGVETMRRWSLRYWKAEPSIERAEWGLVDGQECVLVFTGDEAETERLWSIIRLAVAEDRVTRHHWYFFCPELLCEVAARLDMKAVNHGYISTYEEP